MNLWLALEQIKSTMRYHVKSSEINLSNLEDFTLSITVTFMFKGEMGGRFVSKVMIISFVLVLLILVLFSSVHLTTLSEASCILDFAVLSNDLLSDLWICESTSCCQPDHMSSPHIGMVRAWNLGDRPTQVQPISYPLSNASSLMSISKEWPNTPR